MDSSSISLHALLAQVEQQDQSSRQGIFKLQVAQESNAALQAQIETYRNSVSRLEDEKCQLLCQVASLQERLKHVESKSSDLGRDIESKNHQVLHLKDMMASKEKAAESNRLRLLSEIEGVVIAMHRQAKRAGLDMLPGVATLMTEDVKVDVADPEAHPRVLLSVETQTETDEAMSAPTGTVQPVQPVPAAELPVGGGDGDAAQGGAIKVGCDECDSRKAENDAIRDEFQKLNDYVNQVEQQNGELHDMMGAVAGILSKCARCAAALQAMQGETAGHASAAQAR